MYEITLDKETHTYKVDGIVRPSVTEILADLGISDVSMIPESRLKKAQNRGTWIHHFCECILKGIEIENHPMYPIYEPYISGFRKFLNDHGSSYIASEQMLYSAKCGVCGTIDIVKKIENFVSIIDVKSGLDYRGYAIQTAGYKIIQNENYPLMKAKRRYALFLKKDRTYILKQYKQKTDEYVFNAAVLITRFKGGM